ncbi:TetR/AcrR family transcriptional regulator [Pararhizobium sp.]|uniref:TetR/AcrR family transcriptional regulator n=1 Tax=Pararhizobium sp. TaxID=1977563 RepID=UPI002727785D|nr:TetR/AcrR family transcriptional regulator [Pararhizobium sp.]MDO9415281.1 TetR/AcrR family transcriptional regulator [Pararhizobium sp.]
MKDCGPAGRPAAGADPQKRDQILDGAKKVFMQKGFDAASMNDITREAGVSKGTIYVYFQNKEELFAALIETERARIVASARHALDEDEPVRTALFQFGVALVTGMSAEYTVQAMRTVIGVIDRMPGLAVRFFAAAPESGYTVLKSYLDRNVAEGTLIIEDTGFAAQQFLSLCSAGIFKHRLFGVLANPPESQQIERTVRAGIDMFMAVYASEKH